MTWEHPGTRNYRERKPDLAFSRNSSPLMTCSRVAYVFKYCGRRWPCFLSWKPCFAVVTLTINPFSLTFRFQSALEHGASKATKDKNNRKFFLSVLQGPSQASKSGSLDMCQVQSHGRCIFKYMINTEYLIISQTFLHFLPWSWIQGSMESRKATESHICLNNE